MKFFMLTNLAGAIFALLPTAEVPREASKSGLPNAFPPARNVAPMPREAVAAVPKCCGLEFVGQEVEGPKLGRAKPQKQFDYGNFRAVVGSDGKTRYFPRLGKYFDSDLRKAPPPSDINWVAKGGAQATLVVKQMYGNDQQGDCVWASRYHSIGVLSANATGKALISTTAEVLKTYHAACGAGDNGCDMSAVNVYQQTKGFPVNGVIHKIDGAVSIDHMNVELVKTALVAFGTINVGMSLPNAWYQSADGADWGPTNTTIVGGHEVQAVGYDDKGVWILTWAGTRRILWSAWTSKRWIDETYTSLYPEWYSNGNVAPNGIDTATLKADLAAVANGQVPPLPDPVRPGPPTPPQPPTPPTPPTPPVPGTLGDVTVSQSAGTITIIGPWRIKGGAVPLLSQELKDAGVSDTMISLVLQLIAESKKKAAAIRPGQ